MNTRLLSATFLLTASLTAWADPATDGPLSTAAPATMERELGRQIDRYVTYPLLHRTASMDGDVYVTFVIDTEGRVKVMSASSSNHDLCEYVLRMLAKVDIGDNPTGTWKPTRMRFSFHPEV